MRYIYAPKAFCRVGATWLRYRRVMQLRRGWAVVLAAVVLLVAVATVDGAGAAAAPATGLIRLNQVGYATNGPKRAFLMTSVPVTSATFTVRDAADHTVFSGTTGKTTGRWSNTFRAVYVLDFSTFNTPGTVHLVVSGPVSVVSASFTIATGAGSPALQADAVTFLQTQRDGGAVMPGALSRQPSHLRDATATVYDTPLFVSAANDLIRKPLVPIGGPVDVSGGWFDAGDYLKFTYTAAYTNTLLLGVARRQGAAASPALLAEARHGSDWLAKMWDPATQTLYVQVGIGSGDKAGTFLGDHDVWRLPEADDNDTAPADRYLRNRPVFRAAPPGQPISPALAGRVAAAFALAAQVDAATDPVRARRELDAAAAIFGLAQTTGVVASKLVTTLPHAYYPDSTWRDDLELGAAELALAGQRLGDPRTSGWLVSATHWAKDYVAHETGDTFNLYDVSALAHADLAAALAVSGPPAAAEITTAQLAADLGRQLQSGEAIAAKDPFRVGVATNEYDSVSHALGLSATADLYRSLTGDASHAILGSDQRAWALGANAWGVSFMIGAGTTWPACPQHQVANLRGGVNGAGPVLTGGVVNGPNGSSQFKPLGSYQDGLRPCPSPATDPYKAFTGKASRYLDDVRSWQSNEPADDFTATALLSFALAS